MAGHERDSGALDVVTLGEDHDGTWHVCLATYPGTGHTACGLEHQPMHRFATEPRRRISGMRKPHNHPDTWPRCRACPATEDPDGT